MRKEKWPFLIAATVFTVGAGLAADFGLEGLCWALALLALSAAFCAAEA